MTLSIIEQFDCLCETGEGEIICPRCGVELHQYYHWWVAADHIEHDRCPICDCEGGSGTNEWCVKCRNEDCEGYQRMMEDVARERYYEAKREFDMCFDEERWRVLV